jgi:hypothetical protein
VCRLSLVATATIGLLVLATAGMSTGLLTIPGGPTTGLSPPRP